MTGIEYVLSEVMELHLFIIWKQERDSPDKVTPMLAYYILDGSIYQSPQLSNVFAARVVLPIFPRLVDLPLEKFQRALAHILQVVDWYLSGYNRKGFSGDGVGWRGTNFRENIRDATKQFKKLIKDKKEIEGLPATALGLAAQTAASSMGCRRLQLVLAVLQVTTMAFFGKLGSILRQSTNGRIISELRPAPSAFQAIRCMCSAPTTKLFIGGISFSTDEPSLREAFSRYGEVLDARVIMDCETGRSRGFGFITFNSDEEASSAIQALDGQSHPNVPFEERSRLCKCLNYSKLSFGASKDLAKNPRIPPMVAM